MDTSDQLKALAKPIGDGEKLVDVIKRTARAAGLSYSRCYEIYYRRARRIEPAEVSRIELALDRKIRRDARNELAQLRLRIEVLEARFKVTDESFHRADIDGLGEVLRPTRNMACRSG